MFLYTVRVQLPGTEAWVAISKFDEKGNIVAIPNDVFTAEEAQKLKAELSKQRPDCQFAAWPIMD